MHIGERIKARADKLGVSVLDLANACGITDKAVYKWFSKPTDLKLENIVAVAKLLKTTERWLICEDGPEDLNERAQALAAWEALPAPYRATMLAAMRELLAQIEGQQPPTGAMPDRRASQG